MGEGEFDAVAPGGSTEGVVLRSAQEELERLRAVFSRTTTALREQLADARVAATRAEKGRLAAEGQFKTRIATLESHLRGIRANSVRDGVHAKQELEIVTTERDKARAAAAAVQKMQLQLQRECARCESPTAATVALAYCRTGSLFLLLLPFLRSLARIEDDSLPRPLLGARSVAHAAFRGLLKKPAAKAGTNAEQAPAAGEDTAAAAGGGGGVGRGAAGLVAALGAMRRGAEASAGEGKGGQAAEGRKPPSRRSCVERPSRLALLSAAIRVQRLGPEERLRVLIHELHAVRQRLRGAWAEVEEACAERDRAAREVRVDLPQLHQEVCVLCLVASPSL